MIAAPACAASRAELAICSGVIGIAGCLPTVSPPPVIAQVMITRRFSAIDCRSFDIGFALFGAEIKTWDRIMINHPANELIVSSTQFENPERICSSDLESIRLADGRRIKPT